MMNTTKILFNLFRLLFFISFIITCFYLADEGKIKVWMLFLFLFFICTIVYYVKYTHIQKCFSCKKEFLLDDTTFSKTWSSTGYRHTIKDGSKDRRYKNNFLIITNYERHTCPACNFERNDYILLNWSTKRIKVYNK